MRWPLSVPVLHDGVVTLRAHTTADLDAMVELARDADTVRWTSVPDPYDRAQAEWFALRHVPEGWDSGASRGWAIEYDGRFAGNVDVRGTVVADVGFALHPAARGHGVMARAVRLAVDWTLSTGVAEVVHWRSRVGNIASLRVAHAAGFSLGAVVPGLLAERGHAHDAWTGWFRFGDAPVPRTRWHDTVLDAGPVRLRPMRPDDAERVAEACADRQTQHWLTDLPHPFTQVSAHALIATAAWDAARGAAVTWAVADPADDRLLGTVAVMDLAGIDPTCGQIGYWLHPDARGRGLVSAALPEIVRYALDPRGLDRRRLVLLTAAGNHASRAIAERAGFGRAGTQEAAEPLGDGTFDDLVVHELLR